MKRKGREMGVDFNDDPADAGTASGDLIGRVIKLERECASLKRMITEMPVPRCAATATSWSSHGRSPTPPCGPLNRLLA